MSEFQDLPSVPDDAPPAILFRLSYRANENYRSGYRPGDPPDRIVTSMRGWWELDPETMSMQLSLLAEDKAVAPAGLEYLPEFLSPSEEVDLTDCIYAGEWLTDLSRRVQHYGYKLAFKIRRAATEEAARLLDARRPFEQAIINEYEPGQGIAPHIDRDCFGPVVATVSLVSAVNMDFFCGETGDEHVRRLEPRSLVLLYGDARWRWRHGIAKRRTDTWHGQKIARQRRVSITFRTVTRSDAGITP